MTTMTMTGTTCGANCWYAKEPECRCSCGGGNHGLLLTDSGAPMPRRNRTIMGKRYVLGAMDFGGPVRERSRKFRASLDRETYGAHGGRFSPPENEQNAVVWSGIASEQQAKWPEVERWTAETLARQTADWEAFMARVEAGEVIRGYRPNHPHPRRPDLLWVREDVAALYDAMEG